MTHHTHAQPFASLAVGTLLLTVLLLASPGSSAQALTDSRISAFIDSLEAAEQLEPEFRDLDEERRDDDGNMPDFSRIFSEMLEQIEGHPAYGQLQGLVEDHGFDSMAQWAATGDRVYRAWMAIEMQQEAPRAQQDLARALADIDNNPNMSAAQKAQMRTMMESAMGAMASASAAPPEDIEAVRPHLEALRAMAEDDDGEY